jgi:hypothetical protein
MLNIQLNLTRLRAIFNQKVVKKGENTEGGIIQLRFDRKSQIGFRQKKPNQMLTKKPN